MPINPNDPTPRPDPTAPKPVDPRPPTYPTGPDSLPGQKKASRQGALIVLTVVAVFCILAYTLTVMF